MQIEDTICDEARTAGQNVSEKRFNELDVREVLCAFKKQEGRRARRVMPGEAEIKCRSQIMLAAKCPLKIWEFIPNIVESQLTFSVRIEI